MKIRDLIKDLKTQGLDTEIIATLWYQEDIEECANSMGKKLTKKQIEAIMEKIDSPRTNLDWDIIEYYINEVENECCT